MALSKMPGKALELEELQLIIELFLIKQLWLKL